MKHTKMSLREVAAKTSPQIQQEVELTFSVSDRIYQLMLDRGLTRKQLAEAVGRRPSEVTKWLSGQHNFTLRTIAMLSSYFNAPIIEPVH
ncbi:MAG: helix-turn-helix domain-containing protein [Bacteroidales bacterium]|nr:helix-turn-helix domain-containing protein [Bacteroidales bacterium]